MERPRLIGVAGPTSSGKTTLEKRLQAHYGERLDILPFDDMCYKYSQLVEMGIADIYDGEQPEVYQFDAYYEHLSQLRGGGQITFPANSWQSYQEGITQRTVTPKDLVLSVGFLAFHDTRVRDLFDLKIYIDIPEEVLTKRRIERDSESGGDKKEIAEYVANVILPASRRYVEPQREYAQYVIDGTLEPPVIAETVVQLIESHVT